MRPRGQYSHFILYLFPLYTRLRIIDVLKPSLINAPDYVVKEYDISISGREIRFAADIFRVFAIAGGIYAAHFVIPHMDYQQAVGPFVTHSEVITVFVGHSVLVPIEVAQVVPRWHQLLPALENATPVHVVQ